MFFLIKCCGAHSPLSHDCPLVSSVGGACGVRHTPVITLLLCAYSCNYTVAPCRLLDNILTNRQPVLNMYTIILKHAHSISNEVSLKVYSEIPSGYLLKIEVIIIIYQYSLKMFLHVTEVSWPLIGSFSIPDNMHCSCPVIMLLCYSFG